MSTNSDGYAGQWDPTAGASGHNAMHFIARMLIARMSIATLVKVAAVSGGGEAPVGMVDVQPLVNLIDASGQSSSHGVLHKLPYFRYQGGNSAIILDPKKDDVGLALFADRDISSVIAKKGQANPGSRRRFDMADGLYIGGFLGDTPSQYFEFQTGGTKLLDVNGNQIVTSSTGINATPKSGQDFKVSGPEHVTGNTLLDGTLGVGGNTTLNGTLGVVGHAGFAAGVDVAGALTALSLQINGTQPVKRILFGSMPSTSTGAVGPSSVILFATITVTGAQVGDHVILTPLNSVTAPVQMYGVILGANVVSIIAANPNNTVTYTPTVQFQALVIGIT